MDLKEFARLVTIDTGNRVRVTRERRALTREQLAALSGHPVEVITDLEQGYPEIGAHLHELTEVFTALSIDLTSTVDRAGEAIRARYGDPAGLPPRPHAHFSPGRRDVQLAPPPTGSDRTRGPLTTVGLRETSETVHWAQARTPEAP